MNINRKFGYIRVSSKDQNESRQKNALLELGINERDIYMDKSSGKDFDRIEYQLLKRSLRKGDILYIHSLDRLGRNKQGLVNEWNDIINNIGADIIVLNMPLLDTTKNKDSFGTFISDLVLQILSWVAEEERKYIRQRQREGIDIALQNGVKMGRPKIKMNDDFIDAYKRWKNGDITAVQAMKDTSITKSTFYRLVKEYEEKHITVKS